MGAYAELNSLVALQYKARGFSLRHNQPVHSLLFGRRASHVRGRGLDFEELRNYVAGDDVRSIDWRVTARMQKPYVRVYSEERDRPTMLVVDQRINMFFRSRRSMKSVVAAEAAALAAWRVSQQGDRICCLTYDPLAVQLPASEQLVVSNGELQVELRLGEQKIRERASSTLPTNAFATFLPGSTSSISRCFRSAPPRRWPSRCVIFSAISPHAGGAYDCAARQAARLLSAASSIVASADDRLVCRLRHRRYPIALVRRASRAPLDRKSLSS
ncbi:MAG TPA: DUF58 domain-containing protein [Edaphobacter sp.]